LRHRGAQYRSLEEGGLRLAVTEARVRYRQPALYDDLLRVPCWVRELTKRSIEFGYLIERAGDGVRLATAVTKLVALDRDNKLSTIPEKIRDKITVVADPVRI
jgi:acyl-CoA thioester hydrolase